MSVDLYYVSRDDLEDGQIILNDDGSILTLSFNLTNFDVADSIITLSGIEPGYEASEELYSQVDLLRNGVIDRVTSGGVNEASIKQITYNVVYETENGDTRFRSYSHSNRRSTGMEYRWLNTTFSSGNIARQINNDVYNISQSSGNCTIVSLEIVVLLIQAGGAFKRPGVRNGGIKITSTYKELFLFHQPEVSRKMGYAKYDFIPKKNSFVGRIVRPRYLLTVRCPFNSDNNCAFHCLKISGIKRTIGEGKEAVKVSGSNRTHNIVTEATNYREDYGLTYDEPLTPSIVKTIFQEKYGLIARVIKVKNNEIRIVCGPPLGEKADITLLIHDCKIPEIEQWISTYENYTPMEEGALHYSQVTSILTKCDKCGNHYRGDHNGVIVKHSETACNNGKAVNRRIKGDTTPLQVETWTRQKEYSDTDTKTLYFDIESFKVNNVFVTDMIGCSFYDTKRRLFYLVSNYDGAFIYSVKLGSSDTICDMWYGAGKKGNFIGKNGLITELRFTQGDMGCYFRLEDTLPEPSIESDIDLRICDNFFMATDIIKAKYGEKKYIASFNGGKFDYYLLGKYAVNRPNTRSAINVNPTVGVMGSIAGFKLFDFKRHTMGSLAKNANDNNTTFKKGEMEHETRTRFDKCEMYEKYQNLKYNALDCFVLQELVMKRNYALNSILEGKYDMIKTPTLIDSMPERTEVYNFSIVNVFSSAKLAELFFRSSNHFSTIQSNVNTAIYTLNTKEYEFVKKTIYGGRAFVHSTYYESKYYREAIQGKNVLQKIKSEREYAIQVDECSMYPASMFNPRKIKQIKHPKTDYETLYNSLHRRTLKCYTDNGFDFVFPCGELITLDIEPTRIENVLDYETFKKKHKIALGFYKCDCQPNKSLLIAPIPSRSDSVEFDLKDKIDVYLNSVDFELGLKHGYKYTIKEALIYEKAGDPFSNTIFKFFVLKYLETRDGRKKGSVCEAVKNILNSIYGKMIERIHSEESFILPVNKAFSRAKTLEKKGREVRLDVVSKTPSGYTMRLTVNKPEIENSDIKAPYQLGSFILSYSRVLLYDFFMKANPHQKLEDIAIMGDTDSICLKAKCLFDEDGKVYDRFNGLYTDKDAVLSQMAKDIDGYILRIVCPVPKVYSIMYITNDGKIMYKNRFKGVKTNVSMEQYMNLLKGSTLEIEEKRFKRYGIPLGAERCKGAKPFDIHHETVIKRLSNVSKKPRLPVVGFKHETLPEGYNGDYKILI